MNLTKEELAGLIAELRADAERISRRQRVEKERLSLWRAADALAVIAEKLAALASLATSEAPAGNAGSGYGRFWLEDAQAEMAGVQRGYADVRGELLFRAIDLITALSPVPAGEAARSEGDEAIFLQAHDALEAAREALRGVVVEDGSLYDRVNTALYAIRSRPAAPPPQPVGEPSGEDVELNEWLMALAEKLRGLTISDVTTNFWGELVRPSRIVELAAKQLERLAAISTQPSVEATQPVGDLGALVEALKAHRDALFDLAEHANAMEAQHQDYHEGSDGPIYSQPLSSAYRVLIEWDQRVRALSAQPAPAAREEGYGSAVAEIAAAPQEVCPDGAAEPGLDDLDPKSWEVEVRLEGVSVLTLGHEHLSGIANIDQYADAVRTCAEHLHAFIGTDEPMPCFACGDSGQERRMGPCGEEVGPCSMCQPASPAQGDEQEGRDWSEFEDDISDAISDSIDMDWTSRDGARAVVRLLNKLEADRK